MAKKKSQNEADPRKNSKQAKPKTKPRLLISGAKAHKFTKADSRKGGRSRSEKKRVSCIINGIKAHRDLTPTEEAYIRAVENKDIAAIHYGLLGDLLTEKLDKGQRLALLRTTASMLPKKLEVENVTPLWQKFQTSYEGQDGSDNREADQE